jgi:tetratricopeptide (TPR) repeat protein
MKSFLLLALLLAAVPSAAAQSPDPAEDLLRSGRAKEDKNDDEGALADYDRGVALAPTRTDALEGRGLVRLATGNLRGARADFDRVLRADPYAAAALGNRCIARFRLHDGRAVEDCDAGVAAALPETAWPHAARGGLRLMARDLPGADADISEALRRDPRNAATVHLRALLRARLGDAAGALPPLPDDRPHRPSRANASARR